MIKRLVLAGWGLDPGLDQQDAHHRDTHHVVGRGKQTRDIAPMRDQCRASVADGDPTLIHHWIDVSYLPGRRTTWGNLLPGWPVGDLDLANLLQLVLQQDICQNQLTVH